VIIYIEAIFFLTLYSDHCDFTDNNIENSVVKNQSGISDELKQKTKFKCRNMGELWFFI